uniref:Uncharacterized protein n=1 Tax=Sphenodon punctatus TaxID=8508 RepID=A0A8D0HRQ3_SPHPU
MCFRLSSGEETYLGTTSNSAQPRTRHRMGNTVNKRPTPPAPLKLPKGGMMQHLREDITCSICLEAFDDPVSIDCGHNFCRGCLSVHWSGISSHGYRCPECRQPCSKDRMIPDTRLRSLVEKIELMPLAGVLEELAVPVEPGRPVQLVGLDSEGCLSLNEGTLSSVLEQRKLKDVPICLISVLGEQRRGKSFLLNYLLRQFQSLDCQDGVCMSQEAEKALTGFEWRAGVNSTTKGVWIWTQPFWVPSEKGKVSVFLVDTEGSLDLQRSKETSVKLSAFAMLLSSFQILNLSTIVKETDMEYLEMFLYVAETVGRACALKPIQHLELLVRDWFFPPVYGSEGGETYLRDVIQKLEAGAVCSYPRALGLLKGSDTRCYLMPFPGKKLVIGGQGALSGRDSPPTQHPCILLA